METMAALITRPSLPPWCPPPFDSSIPVGESARRVFAIEWFPTLSRMKS